MTAFKYILRIACILRLTYSGAIPNSTLFKIAKALPSKCGANLASFEDERNRERRLVDCDESAGACFSSALCTYCATEMSNYNWDSVGDLPEMTCEEFMAYLQGLSMCTTIDTSSMEMLCEMLGACSQVTDDATQNGDDEPDCQSSSCDVGHPEWLGDGWCDNDQGGCYNSEGCGFDGGDCCEGTCVSTQFLTCGANNYVCKDPGAQACDGQEFTLRLDDSMGDGWNGAEYVLSEAGSGLKVSDGTLESGYTKDVAICMAMGCYTMAVSSGEWSSEITWSFEGIASGRAPAECSFSIGGPDYCDTFDMTACPMYNNDDDTAGPSSDCPEDDVYTLLLHDSYGDGWNGIAYTLREHASAGNLGTMVSEGTLEWGFQSSETVCLAPNCYTMTIPGGEWSLEMTWEIGNYEQGSIGEGGAPIACDFPVGGSFCDNTCYIPDDAEFDCNDDSSDASPYFFTMMDSYGDGWNGANYMVSDVDGSTIASNTLASGQYGEDLLCLNEDVCYEVTMSSGSWDNEISWQIGNVDEGILAAGGADSGCEFSINGFCNNTCREEEVAEDDEDACGESAYHLMLYDSGADGWDGATFTISDVETDVVVTTGTLEEGSSRREDLCLADGCYRIVVDSGEKDDETSWYLSRDGEDTTEDLNGVSGEGPSECQFSVEGQTQQEDCPRFCVVDEEDETPQELPECSSVEEFVGVSTETVFQFCTNPAIDVTKLTEDENMSEKDWGELDVFELCAANSSSSDWPGSCMGHLANAKTSSDKLTKLLAQNVGTMEAEIFCSCARTSKLAIANCKGLSKFNALLREASEACNALDSVDCDYLKTYVALCSEKVVYQFGLIDLTKSEQCDYVQKGCGGVASPALRHWDCLQAEELSGAELGFLEGIGSCETGVSDKDDDKGNDDVSQSDDRDHGVTVVDDGDGGWGHEDDHPIVDVDDATIDVDPEESSSSHGKHSSDTSGDGVGAGAAVGITLALLAVTAMVASGVWWYHKRNGGEWSMPFSGLTNQMTTGVSPVGSLNDTGVGSYKPVSVNIGGDGL
mmetsp:Transcript_43172/g.58986  ORF Transcript_43172/g.58986 Transcript_43172/m.58986 type:complete len:1038 (-) Transcript_43172:304-3417(-)|eukprot:CAMPEP_0185777210 /NCGR_PEP_ID=MMETSP1174-20130828/88614_1 /TAXON_ID=35687 /ORGANISM="Dictyocha speculum, Strain CCMP1381" /LENGTH=1037 /DNA_ID=CAMNT_0028465497 /DNA_START=23 /DNA_END=3136 /DNA_ORIENTATION=+